MVDFSSMIPDLNNNNLPWQVPGSARPVASGGGTYGTSISGIIENSAPILQSLGYVGGAYLDNRQRSNNNEQYIRDMEEVANQVGDAYNAQLAERERGAEYLRNVASGRLEDVGTITGETLDDYLYRISGNAGDYAMRVRPAYDQYAEGLTDAVGNFAGNMQAAGGQAIDTLTGTMNKIEDMYEPFLGAGQEATQIALQIMGANPAELTPAQQIVRERLIRDSQANMMASGLRGAGRAGLAAQNEAMAVQDAQFYDQNQRRQDDAMRTLMSQGYNATGQVANNAANTGNRISNLQFGVGEETAKTALRADETIAQGRNQVEGDIANRYFKAGEAGASAAAQAGATKGNLVSDYYQSIGDIEGQRFTDRGAAAFGKGIANATVARDAAVNTANTNEANRKATNNAFGQLNNAVINRAKVNTFNTGNSNTINGRV